MSGWLGKHNVLLILERKFRYKLNIYIYIYRQKRYSGIAFAVYIIVVII
jgi:hypothetical protein